MVSVMTPASSAAAFFPAASWSGLCFMAHWPSAEQQPPAMGLALVKQRRQALLYTKATRSINSQRTAAPTEVERCGNDCDCGRQGQSLCEVAPTVRKPARTKSVASVSVRWARRHPTLAPEPRPGARTHGCCGSSWATPWFSSLVLLEVSVGCECKTSVGCECKTTQNSPD